MTETQTTPATQTDASANGQPAQSKTTAPKRTASRATRAAAKNGSPQTSAAKTAPKAAKPAAKAAAKPAPKQQPKAAPSDKRNGKRELATRVVLAVAAMVEALTPEQLGVDGNNAKAITAARAEAATMVSTWIHHIPADREQWVKVLPKPDRSDWR